MLLLCLYWKRSWVGSKCIGGAAEGKRKRRLVDAKNVRVTLSSLEAPGEEVGSGPVEQVGS